MLAITSLMLALALGGAQDPQPNDSAERTIARASETQTEETVEFDSPEDKVICRRHKATGSRVNSKRVCKTAREWEAERIEARNALEKGQNQRMTNGGG